MFFDQRNADFLRRARINRRFEHYGSTAFQISSDGFRRADQRAEIRLMRIIDRGRNRDDDEIRFTQSRRITTDLQVLRRLQVFATDLTRRVNMVFVMRDFAR